MKCPSLNPKKCDGELVIHGRSKGFDKVMQSAGEPMIVASARCEKCNKVWQREALETEGLDIDELHYAAQ